MSIDCDAADHDNQSNLELSRRIYDDVRTEFHAWKSEHAEQKLSSLYSADSPHTTKKFQIADYCFDSPPSPALEMDSEAGACMQVLEYDVNGKIMHSTVNPIEVCNVMEQFEGHADYQFCSPSLRNTNARMMDEKYAAFVPFADDPNFPLEVYLGSFKGFQWKHDFVGPDEEVIQFEVVRRLHVDHGVSPEDIDRAVKSYGDQEHMCYLPLRESQESGLLWAVSQRDLPDVIWRDGLPSSSKKQIPPHFGWSFPDLKDDFAIINKAVGKFCPNLNCIQDNCGVHVSHEWQLQTPPFRPKQPLYASMQLRALVDQPCENECFSLVSEDAMDDDSLDALPITYHTVLNSILKLEPDMRPCDLAVICEMTCANVYRLRKQVLGNDLKTLRASFMETTISSEDIGSREGLCAHSGRCSSTTNCPCFISGTRCERNCRCDDNCLRRFPGCNETCGKDRTCRTGSKSKCKCRREERECDPEKCTACNARYVSSIMNARTQVCSEEHFRRHIAVKQSKYGLGAFATKSLKKGTLIGEYVGELVGDLQAEQRQVIQKHAHLNYCFGTNGGDTIDAQWLGNPTRFLNDSKPRKANCDATLILVNGEKRVAITTAQNIHRDAELTLSYGQQYWKGMLLQGKHDRKTTSSQENGSVESVLELFTLEAAVGIASEFIVVDRAGKRSWKALFACVRKVDEETRKDIKAAALAGCGTKRKPGADGAKDKKQRRVEEKVDLNDVPMML
ncbi:SET-domain-containing protein [Favolaschia claudopus]|uniref:SET-domain-containing protein n=1 Tax=Favolaschia claudopus TaxID=2862362 RepID=A0AAW0CHW7_9AGAR